MSTKESKRELSIGDSRHYTKRKGY